jgi:topoisomerase IV subunit B
VIVATDADVDGMHIRLLLLTFSCNFSPSCSQRARVYILQTPLFRVRNKKKTIIVIPTKNGSKPLKKVGCNPEITRFKGLGEISPDEFKVFIGEDIRLEPVTIHKGESIKQLLEFYMGKNTPDRQEFIIENLVCRKR